MLKPAAGVTVRFDNGETLRHKSGQQTDTVGSALTLMGATATLDS